MWGVKVATTYIIHGFKLLSRHRRAIIKHHALGVGKSRHMGKPYLKETQLNEYQLVVLS